MKYVTPYPMNEMHPGARQAVETIEQFIYFGEERGISRKLSTRAIRIYLDFIDGREPAKIFAGTPIAAALLNIEECVKTLLDDGYPMEWIRRELLNFS